MIHKLVFDFEEWVVSRECRRRAYKKTPRVGRDSGNVIDLQEVRLLAQQVDAISFDVFDTLLHRRRLSLKAVQRKTAVWGANLVGGGDIAACRNVLFGCRGFYANAYKNWMIAGDSGDEPLLTDVFDRALTAFEPDPIRRRSLAERIVGFETELEARNLVAGEGVVSLLESLRAMGKVVVATSDMYLPGDSIRRILDGAGLLNLLDKVFVSSEERYTKARGQLFDIVAQDLKLSTNRILHVGDNWEIDKKMAENRGLHSRHYFNHAEEVNRAALDMLTEYNPIPIARKARIQSLFGLPASRSPKSIEDVIDGVIAPAFALAIHDMMSYVSRERIERVFFVTRDGTLLKEIAEALCDVLPLVDREEVPFSVLAMSRTASTVLEFSNLDRPEWLVEKTKHNNDNQFSMALMLDQFNIDIDQLFARLPKLSDVLTQALAQTDENAFLDLVNNSPCFRRALEELLLEQRQIVEDYLSQQGVIGDKNVALIDVGYSGTSGKSLSHALVRREFSQNGGNLGNIHLLFLATNRFMYFNLNSFHPAVRTPCGFMFNHERRSTKAIMLNSAWLEPFTADLSLGKLKGYVRRDDGSIEPVFLRSVAEAPEREFNSAIRKKIVARASSFANDMVTHDVDETELAKLLHERLGRFVVHPTHAEASVMQELRHQEGMNIVKSRGVTRPVRWLFAADELNRLKREDYWVQGSFSYSRLGVLNRLWHRFDSDDVSKPLRRLI